MRSGGRIVDFKVVAKSPNQENLAHLHQVQLTAYSILYRDATGRSETALELHHLVKTKAPELIVSSLLSERLHLWPDKSLVNPAIADRMGKPADFKKWLNKYWQRVSEWPKS